MMRIGVIRSVYFSVKRSDAQNWSSSKALEKLSRPTYSGGVISDQSLSEIQNIRANGYTVKASTKSSAGIT